jgi:hypothetical protein
MNQPLKFAISLFALGPYLLAQEPTGILQVRVTDPSGAAIPGAQITLAGANDSMRTGATDITGQLRLDGLAAGAFTLKVVSTNFAPFERKGVAVMAGRTQTLSVRLEIQGRTSRVTVSDTAGLSVDPTQNAGQLVLKGSDLDAFSDDAEDLSNELQMLAGPAAGPDGGQIYIDGFSGGRMPPKQSIREIRVNQNPFSSEYDHVGFGRVEVFTKPGADRYHGQTSFDFANRALTARNPYLISPIVPDYRQEFISGNVTGPLSKRASFFADVDRRITDENSLLNYTDLDGSYQPVLVSGAVVAPSRRISTSPRLDYSLTSNATFTLRYSFQQTSAKNQGIGSQSFDQASRAYGVETMEQSAQFANSIVLGQKAENDIRFQFFRTRTNLRGVSNAPEIDVQGAFTGGGTFMLNYADRNRYEFQDMVMLLRGRHTIKIGGRLRDDRLEQRSETNFNGRFIFTAQPGLRAIDVYRQNRTLAVQGLSQAAIAAAGFGPSEFLLTTGQPVTQVNLFDAGVFVQDDWRVKPNLSISGGLRLESQNAIADRRDFAPRVGVAWAPSKGASSPRTVLRAGAGVFYDRFTADQLLRARQLNGSNQTQFIVRNPAFFPEIPDPAALDGPQARTIYQVDSRLHAPYLLQAALGIERQIPRNISLAVNYAYTRGLRQLRSRDINAPYPIVFDSSGRSIGPRPYGNSVGDAYQYEASGFYRQHQLIVSATGRLSRRISAYGYYVYGRAMSDTDGPGTLPSNPYDLRSEYGRAAYDNRHRGFLSATANLPLRIRMAPFLFLQSGRPYNVTSGVDANGDGNPNDDRPAFATDPSRPTVINKPGFGAFDTAPATLRGAAMVPRNYLEGPGILSLTVRLSRSWTFGEPGRGGGNTGGDEIRGGESIRLSGNANQRGMATVFGGVATAKRYNLTLTASIRNALNNVNPATPIGNLSSPFFGKSIALNTFGPLPGAGPNAGAGNRHIELQLRVTF